MRKKLFLVSLVGLMLIGGISTVQSHNNSAPNFECISCHGEEGAAQIKVEGMPKSYVPGKTYKMTLAVSSPVVSAGDNAGGFAVEASAGELIVMDKKNTQLSGSILTHTQEGAALRKWAIGWKAPKQKMPVDISVMAVSANGDFSPAGDMVGADGYTVKPGK